LTATRRARSPGPGLHSTILSFLRLHSELFIRSPSLTSHSDAKRIEIVHRMNENNKMGKEAWVRQHLGEEVLVIVVYPTQTKKEALVEKYGESEANRCKLIDDYDKNTRMFGENGFLIESAGDVRLQTYLSRKK
jgi:hypothetical protein